MHVSGVRSGLLNGWQAFVLRHKKPTNLVLHFVSAVLFFGSPVGFLLTWDPIWVWPWFASGFVGTGAHYVTGDGNVTLRQATSSPETIWHNLRMWWRIVSGRYAEDVRDATLARECAEQTVRVALVTGAGSGIGWQTVRALHERGYHVLAGVHRSADVRRLSEGADERLSVVKLDVTCAEDRARVAAELRALGRLDCLVHNAARGLFGALEDTEESALRDHMEVGFFGPALLTRELTPLLRASHGALIWISSPAGVSGFPWTGGYCASKHAAEGLAESLYHELYAEGIRVRIVVPSAHRTPFVDKAQFCTGGQQTSRTEAYRAILERNAAGTQRDPALVAQQVVHLAERADTPLRSYLGGNVQVLRLLRHLVPAGARHALFRGVFRRV